MRYVSKPQFVEAVQWTGENEEEVGRIAPYKFATEGQGEEVRGMLKAGPGGAQGWVDVPIGYWVVRKPGDVTDLWPIEPKYFQEK